MPDLTNPHNNNQDLINHLNQWDKDLLTNLHRVPQFHLDKITLNKINLNRSFLKVFSDKMKF